MTKEDCTENCRECEHFKYTDGHGHCGKDTGIEYEGLDYDLQTDIS